MSHSRRAVHWRSLRRRDTRRAGSVSRCQMSSSDRHHNLRCSRIERSQIDTGLARTGAEWGGARGRRSRCCSHIQVPRYSSRQYTLQRCSHSTRRSAPLSSHRSALHRSESLSTQSRFGSHPLRHRSLRSLRHLRWALHHRHIDHPRIVGRRHIAHREYTEPRHRVHPHRD